jgi:cytochrome P450
VPFSAADISADTEAFRAYRGRMLTIGPEALTDARFEVPEVPADAPQGTVSWLRAHVARFSRGPDHATRRTLVEAILAELDLEALRRNASAGPVEALAAALGVTGVADDVRVLARVYLPPAEPDDNADAAVARLVAAFGGRFDDETANRIGLLAQTCAATTTLIARAGALRVDDPQAAVEELVARVLRDDPPATVTRRAAVSPVRAAGHEVAAGETVTVSLTGTPFGAGAHACPGRDHAIALARGALDASTETYS